MARPKKMGVDYFPSDVDLYNDIKIIELLQTFGPLGYTIYDWLIRRVYVEGYYLEGIDLDRLATGFIHAVGNKWVQNKSVVIQVIRYCASVGLFDDDLLQQGVITSVGIQKRYLEITVRRQRNELEKFCILPDVVLNAHGTDVDDSKNSINVDNNSVNVDDNTPKESKGKKKKDICTEPIHISEPIVISLSLNDNSEYGVYSKDIDEWQELFPIVDILSELRKMKAWLIGNKQRRKTKRGILKFIMNWLSKAQDNPTTIKKGGHVNDYPTL